MIALLLTQPARIPNVLDRIDDICSHSPKSLDCLRKSFYILIISWFFFRLLFSTYSFDLSHLSFISLFFPFFPFFTFFSPFFTFFLLFFCSSVSRLSSSQNAAPNGTHSVLIRYF